MWANRMQGGETVKERERRKMDLYCQVCGEPWDFFSLTDDMSENEAQNFKSGNGCPCCKGVKPKNMSKRDRNVTQISKMMFDVLGDDIDGIACEMEDAEMLGYFDE